MALIAALVLAAPAYADMYQDGSNARLPEARTNLGAWPTVDAKADLGCKGDGTTDDTACITAAVARTGSPNIYFGPGTYLLNCGTYTFAGTPTMIGAGRKETTLKLQPGCTLPANTFVSANKSGGGWKDLTIDVNNAVSGSGASKVLLTYTCQNDTTIDGLGIVNMTGNSIGIMLQAVGCISKNWRVQNNYFHLTTPTGATQNLAFAMAGLTPPDDFQNIVFDSNIVVNTAVQVNGSNLHVTNNDISGWGFGTAIYQVQRTSKYHVITGNILRDSMTVLDVNATPPSGVELDGEHSIFANNQCHNLGGTCLTLFGSYNLIEGNTSQNVGLVVPQTIQNWGAYQVVDAAGPTWPNTPIPPTDNVIQNNTDLGGAAQLYSYYERFTNTAHVNTIVRGNVFKGGSLATYYVLHDTTKVTPSADETIIWNVTSNQGARVSNTVYKPGGASLVSINELVSQPALGTTAVPVGVVRGFLSQPNLTSGFTGTLTQMYGYDFVPINTSGTSPGTVVGYNAAAAGGGNGATSGTYVNYGFLAASHTAAAGAGGTVLNHGLRAGVGSGSSAGTTNRGVWITGNGGALSANYAIYSDSTARSYFAGPMTFTALPASAGAGGLAVCVDSAGVLYKKAACP